MANDSLISFLINTNPHSIDDDKTQALSEILESKLNQCISKWTQNSKPVKDRTCCALGVELLKSRYSVIQ